MEQSGRSRLQASAKRSSQKTARAGRSRRYPLRGVAGAPTTHAKGGAIRIGESRSQSRVGGVWVRAGCRNRSGGSRLAGMSVLSGSRPDVVELVAREHDLAALHAALGTASTGPESCRTRYGGGARREDRAEQPPLYGLGTLDPGWPPLLPLRAAVGAAAAAGEAARAAGRGLAGAGHARLLSRPRGAAHYAHRAIGQRVLQTEELT